MQKTFAKPSIVLSPPTGICTLKNIVAINTKAAIRPVTARLTFEFFEMHFTFIIIAPSFI
jgi:hypothetical protein